MCGALEAFPVLIVNFICALLLDVWHDRSERLGFAANPHSNSFSSFAGRDVLVKISFNSFFKSIFTVLWHHDWFHGALNTVRIPPSVVRVSVRRGSSRASSPMAKKAANAFPTSSWPDWKSLPILQTQCALSSPLDLVHTSVDTHQILQSRF